MIFLNMVCLTMALATNGNMSMVKHNFPMKKYVALLTLTSTFACALLLLPFYQLYNFSHSYPFLLIPVPNDEYNQHDFVTVFLDAKSAV